MLNEFYETQPDQVVKSLRLLADEIEKGTLVVDPIILTRAITLGAGKRVRLSFIVQPGERFTDCS